MILINFLENGNITVKIIYIVFLNIIYLNITLTYYGYTATQNFIH
jgi:hypothetical protein